MESIGDVQLYYLADDLNDATTTLRATTNGEGILVELEATFNGPTGSIELTGTAGECVDSLDSIPDGAILEWPETRYESTPESVDLDLLLAAAELPTSKSLRYDVSGNSSPWPGCPNETALATGLGGGEADLDGWIDEQAEILEAAGFETRVMSYIKSSEFEPDAEARRLLAVNGTAALILEAERREDVDLSLHAIIFGSCVEQAGLELIDMDPSLAGVDFLEDSGVS